MGTSLIRIFVKAWPMPELLPVTTAVGIFPDHRIKYKALDFVAAVVV